MRNNVKALKTQQQAGAAPANRPSRRRRVVLGGLLALPIALVLVAPGATALAAEPTSGYGTTTVTVPTPPTTVTTTITTPPTPPKPEPKPKREVLHTRTTIIHERGNTTTVVVPGPPHATTLPFTGLDLRWVILAGMLLLGSGLSIVYVQRGRHGARRR